MTGNHLPNGILLAQGPDFDASKVIEGPGIVDIAPTVLHLLGLPIPEDMDGSVLVDLLSGDSGPFQYERAEPIKDTDHSPYEFTEEMQEQVEGRLRDLDYI